jgi:hypothetical protein
MSIYILFGQRICSYPGEFAPEALEVMSEFDYGASAEWLHDKLAEAEKTGEFEALRIINVGVGDMEKLRELVIGIPSIEAKGLTAITPAP